MNELGFEGYHPLMKRASTRTAQRQEKVKRIINTHPSWVEAMMKREDLQRHALPL